MCVRRWVFWFIGAKVTYIIYRPTHTNIGININTNTQTNILTPSTHTAKHNNTTLLFHRARQLIAGPARKPSFVHYIMSQSHVQLSQRFTAPQTRRNTAAQTIVVKVPDEAAQGAAVVIVWCTAIMHACLCVRVCVCLFSVCVRVQRVCLCSSMFVS